MKRIGYIYEQIIDMDNLINAEREARRNKKKNGMLPYGIKCFDENKDELLNRLHKMLINETFKTSDYKIMTMKADHGKIREIYKLPYFPDRILHHAIIRVIEPYLNKTMIYDSYACIKGKGTMFGVKRLQEALKNRNETEWFLKLDIKKFYPTIDHDVTMLLLRRIFKDEKLLSLLEEIIRSTPKGLPIGLYTSQPIANFILSKMDHIIKEEIKIKYYFRYCDDMVLLSDSKEKLQDAYSKIKEIIETKYHQQLHDNYILSRVGEPIYNEKIQRNNKRSADRLSGLSVYSRKNITQEKHEKDIRQENGKGEIRTTQGGDYCQLQGVVSTC